MYNIHILSMLVSRINYFNVCPVLWEAKMSYLASSQQSHSEALLAHYAIFSYRVSWDTLIDIGQIRNKRSTAKALSFNSNMLMKFVWKLFKKQDYFSFLKPSVQFLDSSKDPWKGKGVCMKIQQWTKKISKEFVLNRTSS